MKQKKILVIAGRYDEFKRWGYELSQTPEFDSLAEYVYIPVNTPHNARGRMYDELIKVGTWRDVWREEKIEMLNYMIKG